jgi:hypothetical protein
MMMKISKYKIIYCICLGILFFDLCFADDQVDTTSGVVTVSSASAQLLPTINVQGMSNVNDSDTTHFHITFSASELAWISALKEHASYDETSQTLYLMPIAKFQYCCDATDFTNGIDVKVTSGTFTKSTSETINTYLQIYGNGASASGTQEFIYSPGDTALSDATTIKRLALAGTTLDTTSTLYSQLSSVSEFSSTTLADASISRIEGGSTVGHLKHARTPDYGGNSAYTLGKTTAAATSNNSFVYDSTTISSGCGANNGVISVVVFLNIKELMVAPAGDYSATVSIQFEADST